MKSNLYHPGQNSQYHRRYGRQYTSKLRAVRFKVMFGIGLSKLAKVAYS